MAFELHHLRFAVLAADSRSFARAAAVLGIKQRTLSRQILYLEQRIGVPLFERNTRGASPTAAGHAFLDSARRILADVEALDAAAQATGTGRAGDLVVGFYTSLTAGNLRATIFEFGRRFPDVALRGFEDDRASLIANLDAGRIDIVIVSGAVSYPGTRRQVLWSERMWVLLPAGHRLANRDPIFWPDLRDETFIGSHLTGAEVEEMVRTHLPSVGAYPRVIRSHISRESVLAAVGAGAGVTIVTEASLGTRVADIVARELHDPSGPFILGFCGYWREDNHNPVLARFLTFVRERYSLGAEPR